MKIPDPALIGFPAVGEPRVLGTWTGHGIEDDPILGHSVICNTEEGQAIFRVNVSYCPDNPKRDRLVVILEPMRELPPDLWESEGFKKIESEEPKIPPKQEEWPF